MLRGLSIRDMLLIDRLELEFQPGLNVLTGETGAGKSILLDSLGFVLGWRGPADLVRKGAEQAEVVAEFDLPTDHPARLVLADAGLPVDDSLILRRTNTADGRKTAFVNDRRCSAEILRSVSDTLVELHGQQDDRGLLDTRRHRELLDQFAGNAERLAAVRHAWRDLASARRALETRQSRLTEISRDREYLEHALAELDKLAPEPGEEVRLDTSRRLMQAASRIREDIARAEQAISGEGAEGAVHDARRWLQGVEAEAEGGLDAALAALTRAAEELGQAQAEIEGFLARLDFDPTELENTEERLFAIRGLARKHHVQPDDLGELTEHLRQRLEEITAGESDISDLTRAVAAAQKFHEQAAAALSTSRRAAATRLDQAMALELPPLKMERARFITDISDAPAGPDGCDQVGFNIATNPGAPGGALNKIASGGELSRFLLALKVCLSAADGVSMIFDEIDRGIGGATADAVGRRLAALASGSQVLVVTHSPQVAALGDHHWRVVKTISADTTRSDVLPISGGERIDEIARMLAGDKITEEARRAAEVLLSGG